MFESIEPTLPPPGCHPECDPVTQQCSPGAHGGWYCDCADGYMSNPRRPFGRDCIPAGCYPECDEDTQTLVVY